MMVFNKFDFFRKKIGGAYDPMTKTPIKPFAQGNWTSNNRILNTEDLYNQIPPGINVTEKHKSGSRTTWAIEGFR